jgi:protein-S-isoprenylcysteine O-methyltransferase Ste14
MATVDLIEGELDSVEQVWERLSLNDGAYFPWLLWGMFALALFTYFLVTKTTAPFGKHVKKGYGPTIGVREGWVIMESPALWATVLFFSMGDNKLSYVPLTLLRIYQLHYFNRTIIYPMRMKVQGKGIPWVVVLSGFFFNIYNGYLQGRWMSHYGTYDRSWLTSPQFVFGLMIFLTGFVINNWSDHILLSLRSDEHDRSYKIPRGVLYKYVTCPNYFGEMVEWLGWSILTWSPAGFVFFLYTVANLAPRAVHTHEWYLTKFNDYPKERKYLVPFVY